MSFDINKAYEIGPNGLLISSDDGTLFHAIAAGDLSPVGSSAPIGSLYAQSNGVLWEKTGTGDNDWSRVIIPGQCNESVTYTGDLVTKVIHNRIGGNKIFEVDYSYNASDLMTSIVIKRYGIDGTTLIETQTGTASYSGDNVTGITWVIS